MTRKLTRAKSYPKISTMPRAQSEATAHLEMYKLLVEKKRLQQELESIDRRRCEILERLTVLQTEVDQLGIPPAHPTVQPSAPQAKPHEQAHDSFSTFVLEY